MFDLKSDKIHNKFKSKLHGVVHSIAGPIEPVGQGNGPISLFPSDMSFIRWDDAKSGPSAWAAKQTVPLQHP